MSIATCQGMFHIEFILKGGLFYLLCINVCSAVPSRALETHAVLCSPLVLHSALCMAISLLAELHVEVYPQLFA